MGVRLLTFNTQHQTPNVEVSIWIARAVYSIHQMLNSTTQQPNNPTTQQLNNSTTVGLRHHCYHPCNLNTVCVTIASGRSLPIATRSVPEIAAGVSL